MNKIIVLFSIATALFLMGCDTSVESTEGTDYLLAGYYMLAGEETAIVEEGVSRTTAPAWWDKYDDYTYADVIAMGLDGLKVQNYPEQGQVTYITVTTADAPAKVYKISSRTEYPRRGDLIDYYLEVYYLWDKWDSPLWKDGAVVKKVNNVWTENSKARETMEVVFKDGSVRKEWIAYDTNALNPATITAGYYAQFPLDGDMVIPNDSAWTPAEPAAVGDVTWSSKVYYYQKINNWISWFYKENKEIFGVRYYTEKNEGNNKFTRSSLAFEHTLSRTVPTWSDESWFSDYLDWIFTDNDAENLSETVIRYEIGTNGQKTVKSSTKVVPTFGESFTIDNQMDYTFE